MLDRQSYFIREHVGFMKLSNTYDILDPQSQRQIGIAQERPGTFIQVLRFLINKQLLPTKIFIYSGDNAENDGALLFSIQRGITLFRSRIDILDRDGRTMGWMKSKAFSLGGAFRVHDAADNEVALVKGDWKGWNFRFLDKSGKLPADADTKNNLKGFKQLIDKATKFIPTWVKVTVAIALGLGTMVGWKRIVVTVGEKIGKTHLTYAQGASAELVAMATIGAADAFGLPVSTTHVLSSGVAGTMAANKSGLQGSTIRNLLTAWVLTLPAAIILSGTLYWLFSFVF